MLRQLGERDALHEDDKKAKEKCERSGYSGEPGEELQGEEDADRGRNMADALHKDFREAEGSTAQGNGRDLFAGTGPLIQSHSCLS